MKAINISDDIIPIAGFKAQASKVINSVHSEGRPVVITQKGKPVAVLISPEDFDAFCETNRFLHGFQEGISDYEENRLLSDENLTALLKKRYGASK